VKLDVDTLATVPDAPPAAGPDRALDPPPADPRPPAEPLPAIGAEGDVAVAEDALQAASPITAPVSAPAMIHRLLVFDSNRRTLGRRCSNVGTEADEAGEDAGGEGGAAPAPPELSSTGGPDVALETGRAGTVSWGLVGSSSFMIAFLLPGQLSREWQQLICGSCGRPVRGLCLLHRRPCPRVGALIGCRQGACLRTPIPARWPLGAVAPAKRALSRSGVDSRR
jgi:hypothetical protein